LFFSKDASPSKKKRKSGITHSVESLELIAMGTTSGSMMLYSVAKAELYTQMVRSVVLVGTN